MIDDEDASVLSETAHIDGRGRLSLLPRWRRRMHWLSSTQGADTLALMVFREPGLLGIRDWKVDGPRVQQRYEEISNSQDIALPEKLEALRLIQDRYQRLIIPSHERPSLGEAALAHLGLPIEREQRVLVYVAILPDEIQLYSSVLRNSRLVSGHHLIDDLP